LKEDLNNERRDLTKMYEILKENNLIDKWFYGHFHLNKAEYYEYTDFMMIGIDTFREILQGNETE
jgi:hypothetical protein